MKPKDPVPMIRVLQRSELIGSGFDDRAIRRALAAGTLVRVNHGAYVAAGDWEGLDEAGRHRLLTRAAYLQARTPVVVSHLSAAVELGAPTWGLRLDQAHLTRRDRRAGRNEPAVVQHRGLLLPDDVVVRGGLDVTHPAVTVLDVIAATSTEVGLVVASHFLRTDQTDAESLEATRRRHEHRPGTLNADLVLRLADGRIESVGEGRCVYAFFRSGLPMPRLQHEVVVAGEVVARLDFAWPELGVFAEFDGKVKYGRLLAPGQSVADVVDAEKRREETVCRVTGWRCLRITWQDLADPARLAWRVRQLAAHHRAA